jgi:clan AA aspartic protease
LSFQFAEIDVICRGVAIQTQAGRKVETAGVISELFGNHSRKTNKIMRKDIELGQKIKMHMGPRGETFISLMILNEDENLSEEVEFLIDTGFNGYLQLQEPVVSRLKLKIIDKKRSKGFDGVEKEVGVTTTKIRLLNEKIGNFPIQIVESGPFLIGTNLLKDVGKMIIIDYRNGIFTLTGDKKVQKKVNKAVEKYAR